MDGRSRERQEQRQAVCGAGPGGHEWGPWQRHLSPYIDIRECLRCWKQDCRAKEEHKPCGT